MVENSEDVGPCWGGEGVGRKKGSGGKTYWDDDTEFRVNLTFTPGSSVERQ